MGKEMESVVTKGTGVDVTDQESENVRAILAENISAYRQKLKMTRGELAAKIGASEAAIGQYERGTRTPQITFICKLADVFNVPVDLLVGHGNSEYDSVMEYRFDRAIDFIRKWGYLAVEAEDGTIKISENNNKTTYNFYAGVFEVNEKTAGRELINFKNRDSFIVFSEKIISLFAFADGAEKIVSHIIYALKSDGKLSLPDVFLSSSFDRFDF